MIIHLTGADTYRSAQRLAELRAVFIAKHDPRGLNTVTLDGETATAEELRGALTTVGLFASRRFVALDRYGTDRPIKPNELVPLLDSAAAKDHDVIVVVRDVSVTDGKSKPKRKTAAKKKSATSASSGPVALPNEKLELFPRLTESQAVTWLQHLAKTLDGSIAPAAATRLVIISHGDSWRMATELEKLVAYASGRPITVADVEAMVPSEYASDIFALTDALGQRQSARALELINRELTAGTNAFALIATLASHVRNLYWVKRAQERGVAAGAIATELGLHPFVVQKATAQAPRFRTEELRDLHHRLLTIDHDLKSSPLDAETLLDLIVLQR